MDRFVDSLIAFISEENNPLGLVAIALSAAVEYVFPPFPGDTITLLGATLVTSFRWNFAAMFTAVMAGSVAGSMLAFHLGRWWHARRCARAGERPEGGSQLDGLVQRFRRHGPVYLVLNRFLPGVRALFFVAAGLAGMRPAAVLLYSALSAALWNLAIMAAGAAVGANLDLLRALVARYTGIAWLALAAVGTFFAGRALWRRHRQQRTGG